MTWDIVGILIGGTVMIVIVGVLDDKYQLPAKSKKLLGQILVRLCAGILRHSY